MTDLKDILVSGKAPNADANASTEDAEKFQAYMESLFNPVQGAEVHGLVINTTETGRVEAQLIPLEDVVPKPKPDQKFYYHLQVSTPVVGSQDWAVSSWLDAVEHNGIEVATRNYMGNVDPNFSYLNYPPAYKALEDGLQAFWDSL